MSVDFEDDGASFPRRRLRFLADLRGTSRGMKATVPRWLVIWPLVMIFATFAVFGIAVIFTAIYAALFG